MYTTIIFDLDGTLLDTIDDLADSMNAVLISKGLPVHEVNSYKIFVGDGLPVLAKRSLPFHLKNNNVLIGQVTSQMRLEYSKRWDKKSRPYPGINKMLQLLKKSGIKTAVLSNKPDDFTKMCVDKLLPKDIFTAVLGVPKSGIAKPEPKAAARALAVLSVNAAKVLYVGDTNTDMKTAVNAGFFPVGVSWGFRNKKELLENGARAIIDKPEELLNLL